MRLVLALALALGASAPQSTPEARPADRAPDITLDVVVDDAGGKAVESLGPSDFEVTEQSRRLTIEKVHYVRATGSAPAPLAAPISPTNGGANTAADSRRLIAIFLDEFHVTPGPGAERVRTALARFVTEDLGPADLVVVLKPLESLLDIRLTSDHRAALQAIESFDPRRGDYSARTSFEQNFIAGTPQRIETARAQIAASSLDALASELGRFSPARKTLIVVSEGFTRTVPRRGDDLLPGLDSVVIAANRAHVSIYPIQPLVSEPGDAASALAARDSDEQARLREALRSLADGTNGRTTGASDDFAMGLKRALTDASGYYVLTLSHADTPRDGRFHPVDVVVRRPGMTALARKGFWAPSDEDAVRRASIASSSILPFAAQFARRTSPLIRPWFGISRTADGATRVSFVWEPAPRVPGDRNAPPAPAQVGLSVTTLDGSPVFEGVVLPSTGVSDPEVARQSEASFETVAGRFLVQMAIKDVAARVVDRDVRDLVVRGFPGPVALGSSEVLRARNAREYQALASDPDAAPVASRQFSRMERLLIRLPVVTSGASPVVSARLVSSFGGAMRDLAVSPVPSRASEFQVDVPLGALANGAYAVEWTARTSDGEARDSVPFRVTP